MKRETFLTVIIIALLLLNFGTLGFLFLNKPHPPGHFPPGPQGGPGVGEMLMQNLSFSTQQREDFEKLRFEHRSSINKLDEQNNQLLVAYLQLLQAENINTSSKDSLEKEMARIQIQKADVTINHFQKVKALCSPEQKKKFDEIIPDLIQVIAAPKNGPPMPPR
ncbi:MAG: periplasmic heavy metal sensor [Chitinophagales bacterium]